MNTETSNGQITTSLAARLLRCSENTVRNFADRGVLPCTRVGTIRAFWIADVQELAERLTTRGR